MFFTDGGTVLAEGRGSDEPLKHGRGHHIWFVCGLCVSLCVVCVSPHRPCFDKCKKTPDEMMRMKT